MQKKYGLVGVPIILAFLIVALGSIQLLPNLNTETQSISVNQPETVPEIIQPQTAEAEEQPVREYTLIIEQTDIQVSPNAVWHAWTYNGTIPAPTLRATQGELLKIRVINNHDIAHSLHAHMTDYDMKHDGSPVNAITGIGEGSIIQPGGEWTYEYNLDTWGTTFFHDHTSSEGHGIKDHILQGLYGAIIVERDPPKTYIDRDIVIVMSEIGYDVEKTSPGPTPYFIMNGMGMPGGEHALKEIFEEQGFDGVAAQFNSTMPVFKAKVGETVQFHVINLGDQIHSFHLHGLKMTSSAVQRGTNIQGTTIPLIQGTLETFIVHPDKPAIWLYHCHVVSHADAGMIGLFIVEE
jgi:FtsP/CotA-like multicopper oxidase with cupredoxin domain